MRELLRAAPGVRAFPLVDPGGAVSAHVDGTSEALQREGHRVERVRVDFEIQRGAGEMLRDASRAEISPGAA